MENDYTEKDMRWRAYVNSKTRPTANQEDLLSMISGSLDCVCVLLAQTSESLAILANNTRLIQDKESTEGK